MSNMQSDLTCNSLTFSASTVKDEALNVWLPFMGIRAAYWDIIVSNDFTNLYVCMCV